MLKRHVPSVLSMCQAKADSQLCLTLAEAEQQCLWSLGAHGLTALSTPAAQKQLRVFPLAAVTYVPGPTDLRQAGCLLQVPSAGSFSCCTRPQPTWQAKLMLLRHTNAGPSETCVSSVFMHICVHSGMQGRMQTRYAMQLFETLQYIHISTHIYVYIYSRGHKSSTGPLHCSLATFVSIPSHHCSTSQHTTGDYTPGYEIQSCRVKLSGGSKLLQKFGTSRRRVCVCV